ncbi:MAG: hypothetical protein KGD60_07575 [Candidatus Thorarchaeota archaeon]|nr:hypothetical protein [Candidatus Thorarchaeota archaeon]
MGIKEKKREKTKTKESTKPVEREQVESSPAVKETIIEEETHTPEVVVEAPETVETVESEKPAEAVIETSSEIVVTEPVFVMPSWGNIEETEWMYGMPTREDDRELWAAEWADYLLGWTENKRVHILSLATFISEPPFKDLRNKVDSFKAIAAVLVDKEVAEWRGKKMRQLRVYWRPLEDWADSLYQWALKTGKLRLDVKSIVIQEVDEDFASLPERDIHIVLALMVKKELAEWIDEKRGAILIST